MAQGRASHAELVRRLAIVRLVCRALVLHVQSLITEARKAQRPSSRQRPVQVSHQLAQMGLVQNVGG